MYKLFMPLELHKEDWIWCSDPTLWMSDQFAANYYMYIWAEVGSVNCLHYVFSSDFEIISDIYFANISTESGKTSRIYMFSM